MPEGYEARLIEKYRAVHKRLAQAKPPEPKPPVPAPPSPVRSAWRPRPLMPRRAATRQAIYDVVEGLTKVGRSDLRSPRRLQEIIVARRLACWLGHHFKIADGLKGIGRTFGLTDHSSVWHHIKAADKQRETDAVYTALLSTLVHQVEEIVKHTELEP